MRFFLIQLLCLITFATQPAFVHAEARMWRAEKLETGSNTPKVLYILGITHLGLKSEYDSYLTRKVIPAFENSSRLLYEHSTINAESAPACPNPLTRPESIKTIAKARALVKKQAAEFQIKLAEVTQQARWPEKQLSAYAGYISEHLSEYGLITALSLYRSFLDDAKGEANSSSGPGPIPSFLNRISPDKPTVSIDTKDEILASYCGMGEARIEFFRSRTHIGDDIISLHAGDPRYAKAMAQLDGDFRRSIKSMRLRGVLKPDSDAMTDHFVCERNSNWIRAIDQIAEPGASFVAVGFAHLLPQTGKKGKLCGGLLQDLARDGYSVQRVEE